jgi:hypothetical protein
MMGVVVVVKVSVGVSVILCGRHGLKAKLPGCDGLKTNNDDGDDSLTSGRGQEVGEEWSSRRCRSGDRVGGRSGSCGRLGWRDGSLWS